MGANMHRVSVCVPTYNRCHILAQTLQTILRQTYTEFELVVVDNCSTDETEAVVHSFNDGRIRYVRNPVNVGLFGNQNRCIEEAQGDLIAIYHDHDLYHPDLLRRSVALLERYPRVGMVCAAVHLVDPVNTEKIVCSYCESWPEVVSGHELVRRLTVRWDSPVAAPTAIVRRACYDEVGRFSTEIGLGADRELYLRILSRWDLGYISEPMARIRNRDANRAINAEEFWQTLHDHVKIQRTYIDRTFATSALRRALEYRRWRVKRLYEFWKAALWAEAKGFSHISREGIRAFDRQHLARCARILAIVNESRFTSRALSCALKAYKACRSHWVFGRSQTT
jgi:glycosyltransferase involved in cell wall biosynthesis